MAETPYIVGLQTALPFAKAVFDAFSLSWQANQPYPLVRVNQFHKTKMPLHHPSCLALVGFLAGADERAAAASARVPVINFSNRSGPLPGCLNVLLNDEGIGTLAAEHLLERGFREFAFVGHPLHIYGEDRAEGFRKRLEAAGHPPEILYWDEFDPAHNPIEAGKEARAWVAQFLQELNGPVGILAANDNIAAHLLRLVKEMQPEMLPWLGVVGVDNSPAIQDACLFGAFTSIELPHEAMGETIALSLADAIAKGVKEYSVIRVGGARIVERATTGAPVSGDLFLARLTRRIHEEIENGSCSSVKEIARFFGVTPRALLARFHRKTGQSLRDYILQTRLRRASVLLADTSMSIADIAYASGFSKHAALTEHFGKAYGMTPSDYRNQHQRMHQQVD